jgi:hypothetical protein
MKLATTIARSIKIPRKKRGIVYLVGKAARLLMTTTARDPMAATISPKEAPFNNTRAIVRKKTSHQSFDMPPADMMLLILLF